MIFRTDRGGRVAVSYAASDKAEAKRLAALLNRYRTPSPLLDRQTSFGFAPSRFEASLMPNREAATDVDLSHDAKLALREADHLVVLCSAKAVEDRWIDEEVRTFLAHRRNDGHQGRIHPVLLPGDGEKKLPDALTEAGIEAASDLSLDKDGWDQGVVKLQAALLGMPLDLVMKADKAHKTGRMIQLGITVAVAVLLAGLAGYITFSIL